MKKYKIFHNNPLPEEITMEFMSRIFGQFGIHWEWYYTYFEIFDYDDSKQEQIFLLTMLLSQ